MAQTVQLYPDVHNPKYGTGKPSTPLAEGKSPIQAAQIGIKLPFRHDFLAMFYHCLGQQDEQYHTEGPMR